MELTVSFDDMKKALEKIGKAVKKNTASAQPVDMVAVPPKNEGMGYLYLKASGVVDVIVRIPAEVVKPGTFQASYSDINILSLRACGGRILMKEIGDNTLSLKYKGGKACTILTRVEYGADVQTVKESTTAVKMDAKLLKEMVDKVIWISPDNESHALSLIEIKVADDVSGITKLTLSACDRKGFAIRNEFLAKSGDYTGMVNISPLVLKTATSILEDGDVLMQVGKDGKLLFTQRDLQIGLLPTEKKMPDVSNILAGKQKTFSVTVNKDELLESLNCAKYLQTAQGTIRDGKNDLIISIKDEEMEMSCVGLSQYAEEIEVHTEGNPPDMVRFDALLLIDVISHFPNENVLIEGLDEKSPFWMCDGANGEYIYCVLPKKLK